MMRPISVTPSLDKKKRPKNEAQNDDDGVNSYLSFLTTLKKTCNSVFIYSSNPVLALISLPWP